MPHSRTQINIKYVLYISIREAGEAFTQIAFTQVLNAEGWEVDYQLRDLSDAIEVTHGQDNSTTGNETLLDRIKSRAENSGEKKKALILKTSHVGGHKFAGNVIVWISFLPFFSRLSYLELTNFGRSTSLRARVFGMEG